jgi:Coenzyme PQQ synthesis protein D (PqqD)
MNGKAYPTRRAALRVRLIDGEMVVLDRDTQRVHQLNQTARYIWDRCDGRHTVTEIAERLAEAFDVSRRAAETDVAAAVRQLERVGLLELRGGLPASWESSDC